MEELKLKAFLHKIYNISSRVHQLRSKDITLTLGIKLNTAALSTLNVISQNPEKNMSEISTTMGITKGAISQMVLKLEDKGLVQKNRSENNDKNYFITLTPTGEQALNEYYQLHDQLYEGMSNVLSHYQKEEIEVIWKFLCETSCLMDSYKTDVVHDLEKGCEDSKNCDIEFLRKGGNR